MTIETRRLKTVQGILVFLVLWDLVLSIWAFFFPQLWYDVFHGAAYVDPQALLPRTAANWAAFLLFQAIALLRWRREPFWLLIIAGVRLSDIFTDWVYLLYCQDITAFGRLGLMVSPPMNLWIGWYLTRTYLGIPERRAV